MKKFAVLLLLLVLLMFTGCGGEDGTADVYYEVVSSDYGLDNLPVSVSHGFSGTYTVTNGSTDQLQDYATSDVPVAMRGLPSLFKMKTRAAIDTWYTIGIASAQSISQEQLTNEATDTMDVFLLMVPFAETGSTNSFQISCYFSNAAYSATGNVVNCDDFEVVSGQVTVTDFGGVNGYIKGRFNCILQDDATGTTNIIITNGTFSFLRKEDNYPVIVECL